MPYVESRDPQLRNVSRLMAGATNREAVSSASGATLSTAYYKALVSRDPRFDGLFFVGVVTTRVYCRPVCPARAPRLDNCRFYRSAAEAQEHGYRPCKRCRPENAPAPSAAPMILTRALALIASGALNEESVHSLASRLGITARHLRRLFGEHLGVSPRRYAITHRLNIASQLLQRSDASVTSVAIASGFRSLRRFNSAFRDVYGMSPRALRRELATSDAGQAAAPLRLELAYRAPYDWAGMLAYLARHAVAGVEHAGPNRFMRSLHVRGASGLITVTSNLARSALEVEIRLPDPSSILGVVEQVRSVFDVSADPELIAETLTRDGRLRACLQGAPGLRVPGAWDMFELAVRTIVGQQVSVAAARTLCSRLVQALGAPNQMAEARAANCGRHFPTPAALADADLRDIGMPKARRDTLRRFAALAVRLGDSLPDAKFLEALRELPGTGPWTLSYLRLQGYRDPDAFPEGDSALLAAARKLRIADTSTALTRAAEAWRPWRAYAAIALLRAHVTQGRLRPATRPSAGA